MVYVNPAGFPTPGLPNHGYKFFITLMAMCITAGLFVIARLATRISQAQVGADDWAITAAMVRIRKSRHASRNNADVGVGQFPNPDNTVGALGQGWIRSRLPFTGGMATLLIQQMVVSRQHLLALHSDPLQDVNPLPLQSGLCATRLQDHLLVGPYPHGMLGRWQYFWVDLPMLAHPCHVVC